MVPNNRDYQPRRLRTSSVWPGVFLHASHNLFMQSIFTPLTVAYEFTKWVAGDLGLAFLVVSLVVALVAWLKPTSLPTKEEFAATNDQRSL